MSVSDLYDIFGCVDTGCFAPIYAGSDRASGDRDVRIICLAESKLADRIQSQWDSAIASLRFSHRHLVATLPPVKEFAWIVTEWSAGHLGQMGGRPLNPDQATTLLRQMLEALGQYHANGIIHGGVCPSSFLISDKRFAKLDFSPGLLIDNEVTPRIAHHEFTPPETINPELGEITAQADIYSLGMSVAALCIGEQFSTFFPIDEQTEETRKASWLGWHARPNENLESVGLLSRLPAELSSLLAKMTQKHVRDRPKSVAAILAEVANRKMVAIDLPKLATAQAASQFDLKEEKIVHHYHTQSERLVSSSHGGDKPGTQTGSSSFLQKNWLPLVLIAFLLSALGVIGYIAMSKRSVAKQTENQGDDATKENSQDLPTDTNADKTDDQANVKPTVIPPVKPEDIPPPPALPKRVAIGFGESFHCQVQVSQGDQTIAQGTSGWEVEIDKPVTITGPGFATKTLQPKELKESVDLLNLTLTPQLPEGYRARPGSPVDPHTGLPLVIEFVELAETRNPLALRLVGADVKGTYFVGVANGDGEHDLLAAPVQLASPFYISEDEISNFQMDYLKYLKRSDLQLTRPMVDEARDWGPHRFSPFTRAQEVSVDYFKGRLPSEWEWELAARGRDGSGLAQTNDDALAIGKLKLEISDNPTPDELQQADEYLQGDPAETPDVSPYGIRNMLGRVSEWCLVADGQNKADFVARGGNFQSYRNPDEIRITARQVVDGNNAAMNIGFRVVVDTSVLFAN